MLSRKTRVTITSLEWISEGKFSEKNYWLIATTDKTGEYKFKIPFGIPSTEFNLFREELESQWPVGKEVTIYDFHMLPILKWRRLGCIESGVNVNIGQIIDGLEPVCGRQVFACINDAKNIYIHTDLGEYEMLAKKAVMTLDPKKAEKILSDSGKFTAVYEFNELSAPPLSSKFYWEIDI